MTEMKVDNPKDLLLLLLYSPGQTRDVNEKIVGRTRLMKLMYLFYEELADHIRFSRGVDQSTYHTFRPFHFGPFSKEVYDDIQFLENINFVKEDSGEELSIAEFAEARLFYDEALVERLELDEAETYYLEPVFNLKEEGLKFTEKLYATLIDSDKKRLAEFKKTYNSLPLATLLRYVYSKYPESAVESKIRDAL